jgi:hypothetical protein
MNLHDFLSSFGQKIGEQGATYSQSNKMTLSLTFFPFLFFYSLLLFFISYASSETMMGWLYFEAIVL